MSGSKSLASINIRFHADLESFKSSMQKAQGKMKAYGKQMATMGKNLSAGVTAPLALLGGVAVANFNKQAQAIAQVEQGLKSTGNQVGFTSKQLQAMATDLQNNSLFGDEVILKDATAQLLTFTSIAGTQFERTQLAAMDLATRLGGDLKSATIQLGKALNDPAANLSALSRSGITFATEQRNVIIEMAKTNRLAEAQTMILDELEKQYGGSAAAAAAVGTGGLTQLSNSFGDLLEDFGEIIYQGIKPFIDFLKGLVTALQNTSPAVKKLVTVLAALAAMMGPLLLSLGAISMLMGSISKKTLIATAAILGTLAALALLGVAAIYVYDNWKTFEKAFQIVWMHIKNYVYEAVASILKVMSSMGGPAAIKMKYLAISFEAMITKVPGIQAAGKFKSFGESMSSGLQKLAGESGEVAKVMSAVNGVFNTAATETETATAALKGYNKEQEILIEGLTKIEKVEKKGIRMLTPKVPIDMGAPGDIQGSPETSAQELDAQISSYDNLNQRIADNLLMEQTRISLLNAGNNLLLDAGGILTDSFENLFNGEQADPFTALKEHLKKLIIRLLATAAAAAILAPLIGGIGVAGGASTGSAFGGAFKSLFSGSGGLSFFAEGGIVTRPTLSVTGEAGPEAIIPLSKLAGIMNSGGGTGGYLKVGGEFSLSGGVALAIVEREQYIKAR